MFYDVQSLYEFQLKESKKTGSFFDYLILFAAMYLEDGKRLRGEGM